MALSHLQLEARPRDLPPLFFIFKYSEISDAARFGLALRDVFFFFLNITRRFFNSEMHTVENNFFYSITYN